MVKNPPTMLETWVQSLGWEDPLEKGKATHSSTLAWKIPWSKEPGRPQSMGSQRVGHDWVTSLSLSKTLSVRTACIYSPFPIFLFPLRIFESEILSVMSNSLWPHGLYSPWSSPCQNAGVGSCFLLQGLFSTQGSNPSLPHCRQILYQLSHKGSPRILEWVAYPFSNRIFPIQESNWSLLHCRWILTSWATREGWSFLKGSLNVLWALLLNLVMLKLLTALPFRDAPMNRLSSLFLSCVTEVTPASQSPSWKDLDSMGKARSTD